MKKPLSWLASHLEALDSVAPFSSVSKILEEQSFASTSNQQTGKAETVSDRSILKP